MAAPQASKSAQKKKASPFRPPPVIALRMASARDATPLFEMLVAYFTDMKLFYPPPEEMPTIAWGLSVINSGAVIIAYEKDTNRMVGSVAMERGRFPWNPRVEYFNGVWFYVIPERRKGGTANHLIGAAKAIAHENGLALRLDNVWGVEPEKQDRYRQMHGFRYVGGNHVWFPTVKASGE